MATIDQFQRGLRTLTTTLVGLGAVFAQPAGAWCQDAGRSAAPTSIDSGNAQAERNSVEEALIRRVLETPVGENRTAGDLNLDDALVRRAADRALRALYQERFHVVVRDEDFISPESVAPDKVRDPHPTTNPAPAVKTPESPAPSPKTTSYLFRWGPVILLGGPSVFVLWLIARRIVPQLRKTHQANRRN